MFLYVIRQGQDGPVKIGCATDPGTRLQSMQSGNPDPLFLLGVCRGGRGAERMLLSVFKPYRLRGEWFKPVPEIMSFVSELVPWEVVKAGGECPTIRTPSERAQHLRNVGYTFQEIGDFMGVTRQRAQQLAPAMLARPEGGRKIAVPLEENPLWLGDARPPIADYVAANPDVFKTTLVLERAL